MSAIPSTSSGATLARPKKGGGGEFQQKVVRSRDFALPRQGGARSDLRTRFAEVFKSADKDGQPFGALDEVERAFVINKEDLLSAVERLPNIVDSNGDAYGSMRQIVEMLEPDGNGQVSIQLFLNCFIDRMYVGDAKYIRQDPKVEAIFDSMAGGNKSAKQVTKFEYIEWFNSWKSKTWSPWAKMTNLLTAFGLDKESKISREEFHAAWARAAAEGLNTDDLEFQFPDGM